MAKSTQQAPEPDTPTDDLLEEAQADTRWRRELLGRKITIKEVVEKRRAKRTALKAKRS